jgi:hypothetical protein
MKIFLFASLSTAQDILRDGANHPLDIAADVLGTVTFRGQKGVLVSPSGFRQRFPVPI